MSARIIHLAETNSTNTEAMARALAGEALPFWLTADRQTAGKGRSGRAWLSEPGNFHASLACAIRCPRERAPQLSLVAGVAVMDAICDLNPPSLKASTIKLKWPNDLMAGDAKCGGILIETASDPANCGLIAVIGIGLNLVSYPEIEGRLISRLTDVGAYAPPLIYLAAIATAMEKVLQDWNDGVGFAQIRARWLDFGPPAGTQMAIDTGAQRFKGTFAGLEAEGALLMQDTAGRIQRFTFGDVTLL